MSTQPRSIQFAGESYAEKAERKFKENPAVPLGALATTAALTMAMFKMRAGQAKSFNNWLRMRVVFQGITIAAVCWGTYSLGAKKASDQPVDELEEQRRREEKVSREKAAFEERMKAAEEEFNSVENARAARFSRTSEATATSAARATPSPPPSSYQETSAPATPDTNPKRSWRTWFGL